MARRVCTFAVAHTDLAAQPFNNAARTVRVLVPNNLPGSAVYVKFSNYYGDRPVWVGNATIALADEAGNLLPGTVRPLTVYGDTSFALVPQRDVFSDRVPLPVLPGQTLAVSLYYPLADKVVSGNFVGTFAARSVKGDYCAEGQLPKARLLSTLSRSVLPWDVTSAVTTLSAVLVEQEDTAPRPRVVAAFGDSIMQQGAWVTPFTLSLIHIYGVQNTDRLLISAALFVGVAHPAHRNVVHRRDRHALRLLRRQIEFLIFLFKIECHADHPPL